MAGETQASAKGRRLSVGGNDEAFRSRARSTTSQGYSLRQQPPSVRKAKGAADRGFAIRSRLEVWIPAQRSETALYHDAEALAYEGRSTA